MRKNLKKFNLFISVMLLIALVLTGCSSDVGSNDNVLNNQENVASTDVINATETEVEVNVENKDNDKMESTEQITKELPSDSKENVSEDGKEIKVHYIDVGQADSILIQTPNNKTMLIDAGNNADYDVINNYLKKLGINRLDVVIGTHVHEDHIGSMAKIVSNYEIGNIYLPKVMHTTKTFENLMIAIQNKNLKIKNPVAGSMIDLDKDLVIEIFGPIDNEYDNLNNYSIINKITYKNNSFLFTGDAEKLVEEQLIKNGYNLKADVYKVGHHGSVSSSTPAFINAIKPSYSIVMVGKDNSYGHPDNIVLNRLKNVGSEVYRTDLSGTIIVTSDGNTITVDTVKNEVVKAESPKTKTSTPVVNNTTNVASNTEKQDTTEKAPAEKEETPSPSTQTERLIKGNKNSLIYHVPGGAYYDKTTSNIEWFATEEEAQNAGYRRSKR